MSGGFPDPAVATAKATAALAELDLNKIDHIILARIIRNIVVYACHTEEM